MSANNWVRRVLAALACHPRNLLSGIRAVLIPACAGMTHNRAAGPVKTDRISRIGLLTISMILFLITKPSVASDDLYPKIHESFLKEDYLAVDRLSREYLGGRVSSPHREDVLYLQALSLLKLNRGFEGRLKLKELESAFRSAEDKASASASIGDSFFYEGDLKAALEAYRETLRKYPNSDQGAYLREKISEISMRLGSTSSVSAAKPLGYTRKEEKLYYSVQVGSFLREQNALALKDDLNRLGFDAFVIKEPYGRMYRVRVGKLSTREAALQLETRLKKEGHPTKICPPSSF